MKQTLLLSIFLALVSFGHSDKSSSRIEKTRNLFESNGFVVMRKFFRDELKEWLNAHEDIFQSVFSQLYENGHTAFPDHIGQSDDGKWVYALQLGREQGFQEIVMRSPGRYEIHIAKDTLAIKKPSLDPIVKKLMQIVPSLLHTTEDKLHLDDSLLVSTPRAGQQEWHHDVPHHNMDKHEPAHILAVVIPLVDITAEMGPTEFFPSSHFLTRAPPPHRFSSEQLKTPTAPTLNIGDVVIWDFRVLHRGGPNNSNQNRPCLVLSFSHDWFVDEVNWRNRTLAECGPFAQETSDGQCVRRKTPVSLTNTTEECMDLTSTCHELGRDLGNNKY